MCCAVSELRVVLLSLALLAGCATPLSMTVPSPFLRLESSGAGIKATTPDGARLWVREFADRDRGDLSFWASALHYDLEERGYRALEEAGEVRDAADKTGSLRSYLCDVEGREQGYLVAVFIPEAGTVRVVEFVAPRARFDELSAAVRTAISTLGW